MERALAEGAGFLARTQDEGIWRDFRGYGGAVGDTWPTAFVARILGYYRDDPQLAPLAPLLAQSARRIGKLRAPGGWGFFGNAPPDADSTANALICLEQNGLSPDAADALAGWVDPRTGRFATYRGDSPFASRFTGFDGADPSVTALAAEALAKQDDARARGLYHDLAQAALASLWWDTDLYSLYCILTLGEVLGLAPPPRAATVEATQLADGSWAQGLTLGGVPFATGLGVLCALKLGLNDRAARGTAWLLETHLPDGSWPACPIMHFPRRDGSTDEGTLAADHNRTFATAIICAALAQARRQGISPSPAPTPELPRPGPFRLEAARPDGFCSLEAGCGPPRLVVLGTATLLGLWTSGEERKQQVAEAHFRTNRFSRSALDHLAALSHAPPASPGPPRPHRTSPDSG